MRLLIDLGTALYHTGIRLAALLVPKARLWVNGRKGLWQRLEARSTELQGCLWMHCASVGEFEQGRPILEAIKTERPELPILITFFSPSGYEARKHFALATHVDYLPADSAAHAQRLLHLVQPRAALFIKYEFWYRHLHALKAANVPTFLVSAIFRPSQPFFRWYGRAHRSMLRCFTHLFVQDDASRRLLANIGIQNVTISGDTRFDRVAAIAAQSEELAIARDFRAASSTPVIVAGSTWPADEDLLVNYLTARSDAVRSILVPHELSERHVVDLVYRCAKAVRWSTLEDRSTSHPPEFGTDVSTARTLIVDRMGHLSRLYRYADIAYVGGGFGSGIHNTLEAAAWGKPVVFGPNHARFAEAKGLIAAGAGFSIRNEQELTTVLDRLLNDSTTLRKASEAARSYVINNTGATSRILQAARPALY